MVFIPVNISSFYYCLNVLVHSVFISFVWIVIINKLLIYAHLNFYVIYLHFVWNVAALLFLFSTCAKHRHFLVTYFRKSFSPEGYCQQVVSLPCSYMIHCLQRWDTEAYCSPPSCHLLPVPMIILCHPSVVKRKIELNWIELNSLQVTDHYSMCAVNKHVSFVPYFGPKSETGNAQTSTVACYGLSLTMDKCSILRPLWL